MTDISLLIKNAKEALYENELVKEFFRLRELVLNNEEINELSKEVKYHEKEMTNHMNNDEVYFKEKALYESYKNKLDNHPLMVDFNIISNEVYDLLLEVKSILN